MNPRLVEPGFAVVCLHAGVPARPGKDENGDDEAQAGRRHGKRQDTRRPEAAQGRAGERGRAHIATRMASSITVATRPGSQVHDYA
jgi:hypothetical protein